MEIDPFDCIHPDLSFLDKVMQPFREIPRKPMGKRKRIHIKVVLQGDDYGVAEVRIRYQKGKKTHLGFAGSSLFWDGKGWSMMDDNDESFRVPSFLAGVRMAIYEARNGIYKLRRPTI